MNNKLLALGIPTYKRPLFAIKAIENAIKINIYDQIIVSSNSKEKLIINYIRKIKNNKLVFYQQEKNVGVANNYKKIIELCKCKYLHVVSDEDSINKENAKIFYEFLEKEIDLDLVVSSIKNYKKNSFYKDSTWKKNIYLKDVMADTGHFGSSIINVNNWTSDSFKYLSDYCNRKGSIRISEASCLISYSHNMRLKYFNNYIVEMGKINKEGEIRGHFAYGVENLLYQFTNLIYLILDLRLKNKIIILFYIFYYYAHHALHNSSRRFNESPTIKILNYRENNFKIKIYLFVLLIFYYLYIIYYKFLGFLNKLSSILKSKK